MTDRPLFDTFLAAQRLTGVYELSDLSPVEINRMSMSDYAKIRERAGLPAIDPFATAYAAYEHPESAPPVSIPAQPQPPADAPHGVTDEQFLAWRAQRKRGGEGAGIFGGSGLEQSKTAFGRTQYSQSNVEQPARIERVFIQDSPVQGRTMGYR